LATEINADNIDDLYDIVSGGVHYIGKTTDPNVYEGSTTGTILIDGASASVSVEAKPGDLVIKTLGADTPMEYIWDGTKWSELGSTGELGLLAFKDSASTTYTPSGSITSTPIHTDVSATLTKGDYTPAGTNAASSVTLTGGETSKLVTTTIKGVSGTATVHDTPTLSKGTLPTLTVTSKTVGTSLGSATTGSFATEGVVCTVGTGADAETLIFTNATSGTAVTAQGTLSTTSIGSASGWSAGTLPSLTAGTAVTVATANSSDTTVATGSVASNGGGATVATALHTGGTAAAQTFTGTKSTNALVTAVKYDKTTGVASTFDGTRETITVS
jgi:hypothetical protein